MCLSIEEQHPRHYAITCGPAAFDFFCLSFLSFFSFLIYPWAALPFFCWVHWSPGAALPFIDWIQSHGVQGPHFSFFVFFCQVPWSPRAALPFFGWVSWWPRAALPFFFESHGVQRPHFRFSLPDLMGSKGNTHTPWLSIEWSIHGAATHTKPCYHCLLLQSICIFFMCCSFLSFLFLPQRRCTTRTHLVI